MRPDSINDAALDRAAGALIGLDLLQLGDAGVDGGEVAVDEAGALEEGHPAPGAVGELLQALAFNLLALLRAVHLRREGAREATWCTLRDWLRDALLHPALHEAGLEVAPATP